MFYLHFYEILQKYKLNGNLIFYRMHYIFYTKRTVQNDFI